MNEKRFPCKHGKNGSGSDHRRSVHLMELPPELRERLKHHRRENIHGGFIARIERCFGAINDHNFYLKRHDAHRRNLSRKERDVHRWLIHKAPIADVEMYIETEHYDYILLREMWGLRFDEYASRVDDQTILSSLADALKRFHSIKIAPDYAESIDSKINRVRYNISHHRLRKDIYFKGGPRKGNADLSRILGTIPADEGSVLTHGDFNLSNLLFDETGVCAYLDLAEAGFGDPYQDFSTLWASIEACVGNESIALDLLRLVLVLYGISSIDMDKIRFFRLLNELL